MKKNFDVGLRSHCEINCIIEQAFASCYVVIVFKLISITSVKINSATMETVQGYYPKDADKSKLGCFLNVPKDYHKQI